MEVLKDAKFNLIETDNLIVKNMNSYNISINSKYQKIIISKNSSGAATDYKILVNTKIKINLNEETKNLEFNESINIKNNSNSFEQSRYERNVKRNFASSIREKFLIKIFDLNDN